jgi:hypothetical protein
MDEELCEDIPWEPWQLDYPAEDAPVSAENNS